MASIQNFQVLSWKRFWDVNIPRMFDNASFTYKGVGIKFTPVNTADFTKRRDTHSPNDITETLKFEMDITTSEAASLSSRICMKDLPFMQIPVFTQDGFVLKGTQWSLISDVSPASGWYLSRDNDARYLTLQKGSINKLKLKYSAKKHQMLLVSPNKGTADKNAVKQKVSVLEFLKAMSPALSYSQIVSQFNNMPIIMEEFIEGIKKEPSIEQCARNVSDCLGISAGKYEEVVGELHAHLYGNRANIGPERKVRFNNFMSFSKAVGSELSEPVKLSNTVIESGTILTDSIIKRIEDANVKSISVIFRGSAYTLRKTDIQNDITYDEIVCAIYNFCLFCEGLGKEDKVDNFCNKILSPVDAPFEKEIETELDRLVKSVKTSIDKMQSGNTENGGTNMGNIEGIINESIISRTMNPEVLIQLIKKAPNSQQMEETNSLANLGQSYKVTRASSTKEFPAAARDVQKSQYGRVCPYTTSESEKVGINLSLSTMTSVDEYGFLCTPYYEVVNGRRTDNIIHINPIDERGKLIADVVLNLEEGGEPIDSVTTAVKINGDTVASKINEIDYQELSPMQVMGPLISMIPSVERNAGKRLIMGVNAQQQSIPTWRRERPWISTGAESLMDVGVVRAKEILENTLMQSDLEMNIPEGTVIQLINITNNVSVSELFFKTNHPLIKEQFSYSINKMNATMKGSPKHQRVADKERDANGEVTFNMSDIVVYNYDISMKRMDTSTDDVNFGKLKVPAETIKEHALSLGNNIKVIFKSWEGSGYEDSIIVNESFVHKYGLAIITTRKFEHILGEHEKFGSNVTNNNTASYMTVSGLPKSGVYLKAGQEIISYRKEVPNEDPRWTSTMLEPGQKGYVVSSAFSDDGKRATVVLGDILRLENGDKLAGFHGNKGVVGRIVPHHMMPFNEDGEVPDIILNPLGVVARNNLGQMVESGLALIGSKTGVVQILPPFSGTQIEDIIEQSKKLGLVEKTIYDGRTGRKFDKKAVICVMHFLRLEHISTSKYNACSDGISTTNQRTLQLNKGPGGGQRISEMTTWCLNSYGADDLFDTLWTVQSDDVVGRRGLMDLVKANIPTEALNYTSNNLGLIEAYFRVLGMNIVQDSGGQRIEKLTSEQISNLSNGDCNLDYGDNSSENSSYFMLRDPKVFGSWGLSANEISESRKVYGRLKLCCDMIMPIWLKSESVPNLITNINKDNKISLLSSTCVNNILEKEFFISDMIEFPITSPEILEYYKKEFGVTSYFVPNILPVMEKTNNKKIKNTDPNNTADNTGIAGLVKLFKMYSVTSTAIYMDTIIENEWTLRYPQADRRVITNALYGIQQTLSKEDEKLIRIFMASTENIAKINKPLSKYIQARNTVLKFAKTDTLSSFVVDSIAVPPIGYRPVYKDNPTTSIDLQLKAVVQTIKSVRKATIGTTAYFEDMQGVYMALHEMVQSSSSSGKESAHKTVFQELNDHSSKTSVIRDTLLSKRVSHSGRSVIAVNSKLKIGTVGIPISIGTKILEFHVLAELDTNPTEYSYISKHTENSIVKGPHLLRRLKKLLTYLSNNNIMGFAELLGIVKDIYVEFNECKQELISILAKLYKLYPALLGREPSLHKFSIAGFEAVPVEGYAIELHPLACHGFNADFDGDQMMALFAVHGKGIADIKSKMMMKDNLINPKDCELICSINQDMILGLYYATINKGNAPTMDLSSIKAVYETQVIHENNQFTGYCPTSLKTLYDDIEINSVNVQDTVMIRHNGFIYCATAGKILLNALFSDMIGFSPYIKIDHSMKPTAEEKVYIDEYESRTKDYRKDLTDIGEFKSIDTEEFKNTILKYAERIRGCIIHELLLEDIMTKNTISKLTHVAVHYYHQRYEDRIDPLGDTLGEFLNRVMSYGFWSADYSGITLSLYDFHRLPVPQAVESVLPGVIDDTTVIQEMYNDGMITEDERKNLVVSKWNHIKRELASDIGEALQRKTNKSGIVFDPTDNIYMIVASGSRGSTAQIMEISGIIGNVTNASNEVLETPITGNYMNGLSISEAFNNSYTSRRQVMAAQLSTASAGEKTRQLIYMAEHIHIRDSEKACNAKSSKIKLEYKVNLDYVDGAEVVKNNFNEVPAEIWNSIESKLEIKADTAKATYVKFISNINSMLRTNLIDDDLRKVLELTRQRFVVIKTVDSYHINYPTYTLTNKMRYMLLYRCIDTDMFSDTGEDFEILRHIGATRMRALPNREFEEGTVGYENSLHITWQVISEDMLNVFEKELVDSVNIYTIMGCESERGICKRCYGIKYDTGTYPRNNEYIGYSAVQAIGEPTAQIVLDSHKSEEVGDGGSAIDRLNLLLNHPERGTEEPFSTESGKVSVVHDKSGSVMVSVNDKLIYFGKALDKLLVYDGQQVEKGELLATGNINYAKMSQNTEYKNVQIKFWRDFLDVFGNEAIMARNFEPIARSQSEFGVALDTKGDFQSGTVYPLNTLIANNIAHSPVILNMEASMAAMGKILSGVSHSYFVKLSTQHAVNHTKGLRDSNIGRALIGDLKSEPYGDKDIGNIVLKPRKIFDKEKQQDVAKLLKATYSTALHKTSENKTGKFVIDISADTVEFTPITELPTISVVPVEKRTSIFDTEPKDYLDEVYVEEQVEEVVEPADILIQEPVEVVIKTNRFGG